MAYWNQTQVVRFVWWVLLHPISRILLILSLPTRKAHEGTEERPIYKRYHFFPGVALRRGSGGLNNSKLWELFSFTYFSLFFITILVYWTFTLGKHEYRNKIAYIHTLWVVHGEAAIPHSMWDRCSFIGIFHRNYLSFIDKEISHYLIGKCKYSYFKYSNTPFQNQGYHFSNFSIFQDDLLKHRSLGFS